MLLENPKSEAIVATCKLYCCGIICHSCAAILECTNGSFDALIGHPCLSTMLSDHMSMQSIQLCYLKDLINVEHSSCSSGEDKEGFPCNLIFSRNGHGNLEMVDENYGLVFGAWPEQIRDDSIPVFYFKLNTRILLARVRRRRFTLENSR